MDFNLRRLSASRNETFTESLAPNETRHVVTLTRRDSGTPGNYQYSTRCTIGNKDADHNDDVLYFVVIFKDKARFLSYGRTLKQTISRTGVAILQTTLVISAGIAVFFFSESGLLARAGMVAIIAIWAASLTTLLVLPAVIKLLPVMRKQQSTVEQTLFQEQTLLLQTDIIQE